MIKAVLRNAKEDARIIEYEMKQEVALISDEMLQVKWLENDSMVKKCVEEHDDLDVICVDVSTPDGILNAELFRKGYPSTVMMLIADKDMSPVQYMKPTILAAALNLKPLSHEMVRNSIKQIFECFVKLDSSSDFFAIENREEKWRIPYAGILYFEARMKKIYACTKTNEYGFYDTLDSLEARLPDYFVRCHRGYVVNRKYVTKTAKAKGFMTLEGGIEIPLSRSYKDAF